MTRPMRRSNQNMLEVMENNNAHASGTAEANGPRQLVEPGTDAAGHGMIREPIGASGLASAGRTEQTALAMNVFNRFMEDPQS